MIAHIVMNYDVKLPGGVRPENMVIGSNSVPPESAQLQIRLRQ